MPVTDQHPSKHVPTVPSEQAVSPVAANSASTDDGTRALLQSGFWIVLFALVALLATKTLFGGVGIDGARSNAGWLSLMFALGGLPFGLMLLILGIAKWLRKRRAG